MRFFGYLPLFPGPFTVWGDGSGAAARIQARTEPRMEADGRPWGWAKTGWNWTKPAETGQNQLKLGRNQSGTGGGQFTMIGSRPVCLASVSWFSSRWSIARTKAGTCSWLSTVVVRSAVLSRRIIRSR